MNKMEIAMQNSRILHKQKKKILLSLWYLQVILNSYEMICYS